MIDVSTEGRAPRAAWIDCASPTCVTHHVENHDQGSYPGDSAHCWNVNARGWDLVGKEPEGCFGEFAIGVGKEGEYAGRRAALGKPIVLSVCEVAKVSYLKVAKGSFRELGFEIDRRGLNGCSMEHENRVALPERLAFSPELGD